MTRGHGSGHPLLCQQHPGTPTPDTPVVPQTPLAHVAVGTWLTRLWGDTRDPWPATRPAAVLARPPGQCPRQEFSYGDGELFPGHAVGRAAQG